MIAVKNKYAELRLSIYSIQEKSKNYWVVQITNKERQIIKEFYDRERGFAEIKGLEWIRCMSQHYEETDYISP